MSAVFRPEFCFAARCRCRPIPEEKFHDFSGLRRPGAPDGQGFLALDEAARMQAGPAKGQLAEAGERPIPGRVVFEYIRGVVNLRNR